MEPNFIEIESETFEFMADLEWLDGTVLGLLRDPVNSKFWIMRWVEADKNFNKWLLFPASRRSLRLYLEGKLTDEDFMLLNASETVRALHLNGDDLTARDVRPVPVSEVLASSWRPSATSFFHAPSCPDLEAVRNLLAEQPVFVGKPHLLEREILEAQAA